MTSSTTTPPLVLVDGSSYLYRAFHGLPPLTGPQGQPTGAIYGVVNMLHRLRSDYAPQQMVVVFDAPGGSFRNQLYAAYKANRPAMPEELAVQIAPLHTLIQSLGIPLLCIPDVEADDVIATLAQQALERGEHVIISTGDKDLTQLVNERITWVNTMTDTTLDPAGVRAKFGVKPEQIVDYLALVGDSVDNVPGVDKVGPKTAAKWLQAHGDLDQIMAAADSFTGKVGANLRAALESLPLSRTLVTVRRDVDLGISVNELRLRAPDTTVLREQYAQLGFRRWLETLETNNAPAPGSAQPTPASSAELEQPESQARYHCIRDSETLATLLRALEAAPLVALDTETTSLEAMRAEIVGLSFCWQAGEAWYLPLAHTGDDAQPQLEREPTLERLRPWLESAQHPKVGHHLKYDHNVLANHGITLRGITDDSMLASYVLDAGAHRHDLDSLAEQQLQHTTIRYEDVAGKGAKQIPFAQVGLQHATDYAAEDAEVCLRLHQIFQPRLQAHPRLQAIYHDLEIPLLTVLAHIERTGVKIDAATLREHSQILRERLDYLTEQAYEAAGGPFNLASPKQIQEIFFERLGLPVLRRTPKGQPSTAEDVLEQLAAEFPLPRLILEHRGLAKLLSTYTERLPERIHPVTGRVHTSYHQAVAATGRLSSSEPNLQNIPIRTEEGRRIRQAFIAEDGYQLLAADYSQIELRIMAHLSQDTGLLTAFARQQDIHRSTAAEVFGVAPDTVNSEQRRAAKAINFGLIYGMSAFGLARNLHITQGQAKTYIERYFQRYPGVHTYMERSQEQARQHGYAETLWGRRLSLPEINSRNATRRQQAERVAINAPVQGTAADIIKRAMLTVAARLEDSALPACMIMQVHDELVLEVREDVIDDARTLVCEAMRQAADLDVELVVDVGVGDNWDAAH